MTDADKLNRIAEACALAFNTTPADVLGASQHREPREARTVALWIAFRLLPGLNRLTMAKALGRKDGTAVKESVRRVADWRASNQRLREKVDGLYQRMEVELGVGQPMVARVAQRHEAAIGPAGGYEVAWGFSGRDTTTRDYLKAQNDKFAQAMLAAGEKPRVAAE